MFLKKHYNGLKKSFASFEEITLISPSPQYTENQQNKNRTHIKGRFLRTHLPSAGGYGYCNFIPVGKPETSPSENFRDTIVLSCCAK